MTLPPHAWTWRQVAVIGTALFVLLVSPAALTGLLALFA